MAASVTTSRAIYAGLSCGVAFAVPVCAYAVTLPFPAANGIVATCALPFTVGALAGVGLVTAMGAVADARADAHDEDAAVGEHEASHAAAAHGSDEHHHSAHAGSRFFGKRGMPRDVPVIARASGAPSEEDAWAEIDALFSEDSPISCDAAHSKDIYEIAFEELRRNAAPAAQGAAAAAAPAAAPHHAAHARSASTSWQAPAGASAAMTGAPVAAPARPATASPTASQAWQAAPAASAATSTAMFMALAQQRAAAHAASAPANTNAFMPQAAPASTSYAAPAARPQATANVAASPYASAPSRPVAQPADASDAPFDRDADARAALASLDRFGSERLARPVTGSMPAQAAPASGAWAAPAPAARAAAPSRPVAPAAAPAPAAQPAASTDAFADRRNVWAAALDILAEPEEPVRPTPATTAASARRASAIAEGKRANRMHEHVNELIEQELGQVASPSVQHSSREYLRVIQGGTASMPALQAEA